MNFAGESVRGSVSHGDLEGGRPSPHLDGFDDALMGTASYCGVQVCVYDYWKCVQTFMNRDGMDAEEAREWMDYNVVGSYMEGAPVFMEKSFEDDA